jgi:preprotein translocase subunit SecA
MATETQMDVSVFEKIGDAFNNFSEGMVRFITRLMGTSNERVVKGLGYVRTKDHQQPYRVVAGSLLARVNELEESMRAKSDAELKELTPKFRERLKNGETLEDLLPEAFAACREAGRRMKNMRHFDVQILGGVVLHRGNIAEMVTGEGKTLVATLPAFLNALTGDGVHVVTVNDYLARRDCEWMLPIYQALGVTAGYIQSDMDPLARRRAYECDITYGTNSEFGFDYLRDNMKPARFGDPMWPPGAQQVQRMLNFAIIDEVDNILIDEARTPLIISGPAFSDPGLYNDANEIAVRLTELQKKEPGKYFEVKEKEHTCHLTDEGVRKAEELAKVESFYTAGNMQWPHLIDNALKAHHLYKLDRNYIIEFHEGEKKIIIVDEHTGRAMYGRQWSDGLHQAVEAKHAKDGVKLKQETQTLATVTLQNFFKLYKKLAGMTGTAMTEANEFWKIYHLDVIAIPTNKPLRRINFPDLIYRSEREKWDAVVQEIERVIRRDTLHRYKDEPLVGNIVSEDDTKYVVQLPDGRTREDVAKSAVDRVEPKGRPILVGTTDVAKSEKLSGMLKRLGIKHELLNAKPEYVARESEIVAQAGRLGAVTIATNMAGRGTDIILGGNPEYMAWARLQHEYPTRLDVPEDVWKKTVEEIESKEKMKEEGRKVAELGGLHIVGTERHDSRRIDNQLRGRAGRQGDPGTSRFFLSLQDDLMRKFAPEWMAALLTKLGMEEGQAIENRMVTKRIEGAQKKVEEMHFDQRKHLLEYDEVMDTQRKRIYGFRNEILRDRNPKLLVLEMIDKQIDSAVERFLADDYGPASFAEFAANRLGVEYEASDFTGSNFEEAVTNAREKASRQVLTVVQEAMDENLSEDEDPSEWKWQEMARQMNSRYGLKLTDRQLKQTGRENLMEFLSREADQAINAVDLSDGEKFLRGDWGQRSLADWAKQKFQLKVPVEELTGKEAPAIEATFKGQVREQYRQKDAVFPAQYGLASFMSERQGPHASGAPRIDRDGLLRWVHRRFGPVAQTVNEEEFRTQPRSRVQEILLDVSRRYLPPADQEAIDAKLTQALEGAETADADDSKELAEWAKESLRLEVPADAFAGKSRDQVRQMLWNAYDAFFRPEMHGMERSLLLNQLDSAWKKHLLTMDHLRSGIGLVGYAQIDPKTEYKRQGMKEFEQMWSSVQDKVTDTVFKMEEEAGFGDLWQISAARHEAAPPVSAGRGGDPTADMSTNGAGKGDRKPEPIRNQGARVGRNDPCPCGSGKKYKNCHMRQANPAGR